MTIVPVQVIDFSNPVELQDWYDDHPSATVSRIILVNTNIFLIFYE